MDEAIGKRLEAAVRFAREAGDLTLRYFQGESLAVERKSDNSPVTIADRGAEELLRERIRQSFPKDAVIGEEFGALSGDSGFRWILDPIDGTKSFITGVPLYSVLLGIEYQGESRIGVIHVPGLDECVYAAQGQGAWYVHRGAEPRRASVSQRTRLSDSVFLTSQVDTFYKRGAGDVFEKLQRAAYITRTWGDAYGYLLVATGRAEVMVDPEMHIWDAAALLPVLQEAGGSYTDWEGRRTIEGREGIATNRALLEPVLAITRGHPRPSE